MKKNEEIIKAGLGLKEKILDLSFAIEDFLQAISKKECKNCGGTSFYEGREETYCNKCGKEI
ncbi:hypothetical protein M0R04_13940 [Candidatus Dojkabacteria bacterium]|nr:hypothetical protein [Candidatus Dojkabacteria bacterium]